MTRTPLRSADIRERNENLVLGLIHRREILSQSDVVAETGLKAPTVFRIFTELEAGNYIIPAETKKVESDKKGRRPSYYRINPEIRYVVGVDFWAGSAAAIVTDFAGKPVLIREIAIPRSLTAEEVLASLIDLIENVLNEAHVPMSRLLGIGIGAPDSVNFETGAINYNLKVKGMVNFPLKERLENRFATPVYVQNNCAVIGLSEYRYSVAGPGSMLTVLVRSGIRGAFIQNGRIYTNNKTTAMDIGHIPVSKTGKKCSCGSVGCLETVLSEDAIFQEMGSLGIVDMHTLENAIVTNDREALDLLDAKAEVFSRVIRGACEMLSPHVILIVSRSQAFSEYLSAKVREALFVEGGPIRFPNLEVRSALYSPEHSLRGASDLVFDRYFA